MERMVLDFFLAAPCMGGSLRRSIEGGAWRLGKAMAACEHILYQIRALQTHITKYVPVLFLIGHIIRQCHWCLYFPHTGLDVKVFLQMQWLLFRGSIEIDGESGTWMPSHWHNPAGQTITIPSLCVHTWRKSSRPPFREQN